MLTSRVLALAGQLHDEQHRRETARELAAELGAVDLIVFAPDPEIGVLLPAPGLPQTLSPGRTWRAFLDACVRDGQGRGDLRLDGRDLPAIGMAAPDGSVLVLLGGEPREDLANELLLLFPLLTSAFARERAVISASGHAAAAREAAGSANRLANALDTLRRDLQLALSRAEQALRERDAFVSVAAHELNTPITVLMGMAQIQRRRLARADTLDTGMLRQHLDQIDIQARKIARLIEQLLDVSRLDGGQLPLQPLPTEIVELVRGIVATTQSQSAEHTFIVEAPPSLVAEVDPLRLEQVLSNVIDNAIKYSPAGSVIQVCLTKSGETFSILIDDDGLGVPVSERQRIFDRFQRVESRFNVRGLGVGLFVSRQIVELHGGQIHVESPPTGSGSRFVITLPLQHPPTL
ncbi:MAG: HAMP domain-containing histidine kinase [Chloroflexota bacterium]|nr:HAMP domain-containing histidine kinase [Chloroflexota bacterium]